MFIELQDFVLSENLKSKIGDEEVELLVNIDCELTLSAKIKKITLVSVKKPKINLPFQIVDSDDVFYPQILKFVMDKIENDKRFDELAKDAVAEATKED